MDATDVPVSIAVDMSKQVQEAYIVAATRTPVGKAPELIGE